MCLFILSPSTGNKSSRPSLHVCVPMCELFGSLNRRKRPVVHHAKPAGDVMLWNCALHWAMDYGKDSTPASPASVFLFPREHSVVSFITVIKHSDGCGSDNTAPDWKWWRSGSIKGIVGNPTWSVSKCLKEICCYEYIKHITLHKTTLKRPYYALSLSFDFVFGCHSFW